MKNRLNQRNSLCKGLLAATLMLVVGMPVFAAQTLKSEHEPIHVKNRIPLNVKTAKPGDPFEGILTEDYHFGQHTLPSGTILRGKVHEAHKSRMFGRPGFAQFDIHQAIFPSGKSATVTTSGTPAWQGLRSDKVKHFESLTLPQIVWVNLPLGIVSTGTSIPLGAATNLAGGVIFAIAEGARIVTGLGLEHTPRERGWHDRRHHNWPQRYGHGVLRGVGLVALYEFLHPGPNPDFSAGADVPLRFGKKPFSSLFASDDIASVPAKEPGLAVPLTLP